MHTFNIIIWSVFNDGGDTYVMIGKGEKAHEPTLGKYYNILRLINQLSPKKHRYNNTPFLWFIPHHLNSGCKTLDITGTVSHPTFACLCVIMKRKVPPLFTICVIYYVISPLTGVLIPSILWDTGKTVINSDCCILGLWCRFRPSSNTYGTHCRFPVPWLCGLLGLEDFWSNAGVALSNHPVSICLRKGTSKIVSLMVKKSHTPCYKILICPAGQQMKVMDEICMQAATYHTRKAVRWTSIYDDDDDVWCS